jgi:hypothetical protein
MQNAWMLGLCSRFTLPKGCVPAPRSSCIKGCLHYSYDTVSISNQPLAVALAITHGTQSSNQEIGQAINQATNYNQLVVHHTSIKHISGTAADS